MQQCLLQEYVACKVRGTTGLMFADARLGGRHAAYGVESLHETHDRHTAFSRTVCFQQQLRNAVRVGTRCLSQHTANNPAAIGSFPGWAGVMLNGCSTGSVIERGFRTLEDTAG